MWQVMNWAASQLADYGRIPSWCITEWVMSDVTLSTCKSGVLVVILDTISARQNILTYIVVMNKESIS